MESILSKSEPTKRRLLKAAVVFFIALVVLAAAAVTAGFIFQNNYKNKVYPGVYAGEKNLGGLTQGQIFEYLSSVSNELNNKGIEFSSGQDKEIVYPVLAGAGGDIAIDIMDLNIEETARSIYQYGRSGNTLNQFMDIISAALYGERVFAAFNVNEDKIKSILEDKFTPLEVRAQDAKLLYLNGTFRLEKEKEGKLINYDQAILTMENNLRRLKFLPVAIEVTKTDYPKISLTEAQSSNVINQADYLLAKAPFTIFYQDKEWKIEKDIFADWLVLKIGYDYCQTHADECQNDKTIKVGIDQAKAADYIAKNIAGQVEVPVQEAKFQIEGGKVAAFQGSRDGLKINPAESIARMEYELAVKNNNRVELAVEATKSTIEPGNINDLGITEIIGTGKSNFSGSPANRRKNISNGASFVNGTLIKPGEEFSLIKTLGAIDASTGYLPELVIKGNKTVPEYGGGLCQIGTTVFRAAVASGLPITARTNHSYRVQYYEPAGTDATIYDPNPDLKFLNDTPSYVLIQSRIEGNNLFFDFWGTKDGRVATSTYPTIYNIVKPQPTKTIETTDLKPGEKKCTEKAHNGADAYFDYKVTYPNGEVKDKRFSSHYRPWQAVCLVGVEKLSEPAAAETPVNSDGTVTNPANTSSNASSTSVTSNP